MLKAMMGAVALTLASCVSAGGDPSAAYSGPLDTQAVSKSSARFGLELFQEIRASQDTEPRSNVFISPISLSTAFGLLYAGAEDETAAELKNTLQIDLPGDAYHASAGALLRSLEKSADGEKLAVNNALWTDKQTVLKQSYIDLTKTHYQADEHQVDYRNNPEASREQINEWVEQKTYGLIKNLLAPPNVTRETRSILVNTIYMKANWASQFQKTNSVQREFKLSNGETIDVETMQQTSVFKHTKGRGFRAAELPYKNRNTSMVIFLPNRTNGLEALEQRFLSEPSLLESAIASLVTSDPVRVELKLPKLKIQQRFEVKDQLLEMGMMRTFSDEAQFGRIADPKKQPDRLGIKVGAIVHQTFLEVDEQGTEAAAATAIATVVVSGARVEPPPPPIPFYVDHPFLLVIRDNASGAILFLGSIEDPR